MGVVDEPVEDGVGIGEVRGAHDGDKNLRRPRLAGQPVDDHRHRVAGVIDEQLETSKNLVILAGS